MSWDDYFMSIAFLSAKRSKDPNRQVGQIEIEVHVAIAIHRKGEVDLVSTTSVTADLHS